MANEGQLSILKQGVSTWNKWRAENHNVDINLVGANLNGGHLSRAHLRRANLGGARLSGATKHSIRFGEQFPVGAGEKATTRTSLVNAMGQENLKLAMQLSGYSEEEVAEVKIPQPKPEPSITQ